MLVDSLLANERALRLSDMGAWANSGGWLKDYDAEYNKGNIEKAAFLKRDQAAARLAVLASELGAPLIFDTRAIAPSTGGTQTAASLNVLVETAKDSKTYVSTPLVQISPPKPDEVRKQIQQVKAKMGDRVAQPAGGDMPYSNRWSEIIVQASPPLAFLSQITPLRPDRHPKTFELLHLAQMLAMGVVMRFKHSLAVPRPHEMDPSVAPIIQTPGHFSLPSGHATETYTLAHVLSALIDGKIGSQAKQKLYSLAFRVAENRVVAGVHYPIDSIAGMTLGQAIGKYVVSRCTGGDVPTYVVDGEKLGTAGFEEPMDAEVGVGCFTSFQQTSKVTVVAAKQTEWLWTEALKEWD